MNKISWAALVSNACIIWGILILKYQHHLAGLVPVLGAYLLTVGFGIVGAHIILSRWKH